MKDFKDKLSRLLFLEFNKDKAEELFGVKLTSEDLYLPVNPEFLVNKVKEGDSLKNLPLNEFIVGMAYAAGSDEDFKYLPEYKKILFNFPEAEKIIKAKTAELTKSENKSEDVIIMLMGLNEIFGGNDTEDILLSFLEEKSLKNPEYNDLALKYSDIAVENKNRNGHLIKGSVLSSMGKRGEALTELREYIRQGGEETPELTLKMDEMKRQEDLENAYSLIAEKPSEALAVMLPYYRTDSDSPALLFNIARAYRNLTNYEKAVYYLNEALALDPEYADVIHELGINYAMMGDYKTAEGYLRRVYEATKEFGPMSNLIIALFSQGKNDEAQYLLSKAEEIKPGDEILEAIKRTYLGGQ